jgi:hypothetical protein
VEAIPTTGLASGAGAVPAVAAGDGCAWRVTVKAVSPRRGPGTASVVPLLVTVVMAVGASRPMGVPLALHEVNEATP